MKDHLATDIVIGTTVNSEISRRAFDILSNVILLQIK